MSRSDVMWPHKAAALRAAAGLKRDRQM